MFDNRELSVLIWLGGFFAFMVATQKDVRKSLVPLFTTLLSWKILVMLGSFVIYVAALVVGLWAASIWTTDVLGETLFWFFGPALVMFFNYEKASQDPHFFRATVRKTVTYTILLEFFVNLFPMSLPVELVLVPVVTLVSLLSVVAAMKSEHWLVKQFLDQITAGTGFLLLGYAALKVLNDPEGFATLGNLRELVVPLLLTLGLLPYIYVFAVVLAYSGLFFRLSWRPHQPALVGYAKRRAVLSAKWRLSKARRFVGYSLVQLKDAETKEAVKRVTAEIAAGRLTDDDIGNDED